ncbi:MAG: hypothetical protein R3359_03180 [Marinirhabdus sp.]|nr:hypothetical protein [Marinirhabdus sp.]
MNTLVSIVMGIVLNLLGVEMQERKQLAQLENQTAIECRAAHASSTYATKQCTGYTIASIKNEHKCKLSK